MSKKSRDLASAAMALLADASRAVLTSATAAHSRSASMPTWLWQWLAQ